MGHPLRVSGSIPTLLVVCVFIDPVAWAVEFHGAALRAHVDLKLAGRAPALPTVVTVAHAVPAFAEHERKSAPRRHAHKSESGKRTAQQCESVHPFLAKEHGDRNDRIDNGHVASLDADDEEHKKLRVAIKNPDGHKQSKDAAEAAVEWVGVQEQRRR